MLLTNEILLRFGDCILQDFPLLFAENQQHYQGGNRTPKSNDHIFMKL